VRADQRVGERARRLTALIEQLEPWGIRDPACPARRPVARDDSPGIPLERNRPERARVGAGGGVIAAQPRSARTENGDPLDQLPLPVPWIRHQHDVADARLRAQRQQAVAGHQRRAHRSSAHLDDVEMATGDERGNDGEKADEGCRAHRPRTVDR
jgi:hypothetical protein